MPTYPRFVQGRYSSEAIAATKAKTASCATASGSVEGPNLPKQPQKQRLPDMTKAAAMLKASRHLASRRSRGATPAQLPLPHLLFVAAFSTRLALSLSPTFATTALAPTQRWLLIPLIILVVVIHGRCSFATLL